MSFKIYHLAAKKAFLCVFAAALTIAALPATAATVSGKDSEGRHPSILFWGPADTVSIYRCEIGRYNIPLVSWGGVNSLGGYSPSQMQARANLQGVSRLPFTGLAGTFTLETPATAPLLSGLTRYEMWVNKAFTPNHIGWFFDNYLTVSSDGSLACTMDAKTLDKENNLRALTGTIYTVNASENPKLQLTYTGREGAISQNYAEAVNLLKVGYREDSELQITAPVFADYTWLRFNEGQWPVNQPNQIPSALGTANRVTGKKYYYSAASHNMPEMSAIDIKIGAFVDTPGRQRQWTFPVGGRKINAERFELRLNTDVLDENTLPTTVNGNAAVPDAQYAIDSRTIGVYNLGDFVLYSVRYPEGDLEHQNGTYSLGAPQGTEFEGDAIPDIDICFTGKAVYPQCVLLIVIEQSVTGGAWNTVYMRAYDTAVELGAGGDARNFCPINENISLASPWVGQPNQEFYPAPADPYFFKFNLKDVAIQDAQYRVRFFVRLPYDQEALIKGTEFSTGGTGQNYRVGPTTSTQPLGSSSLPVASVNTASIISTLAASAGASTPPALDPNLYQGATGWVELTGDSTKSWFSVKPANLSVGPDTPSIPATTGGGVSSPASTIVTDE